MKHYSRRELYALGETLGESATRLKPGGRVYGGGGGVASMVGSSLNAATAQKPTGPAPFSSATASPVTAAPTQTPLTQTESQTGISDYARPYVESMLGATQQQLFNYDPSGNMTGLKGYTPYSYDPAQYVAGFSPLQQQAQQGIASLTLPGAYQQAMDVTGSGISGLLGTAGQARGLMGMGRQAAMTGQNYAQQATNPYAVGAYMNPYLQQSLAPQIAEAQRQAGIAGTQLAGQAVGSGAFGGSRYGLQQSELQRNLGQNISNIVGQGYNQAFNNAQQAQQFGANLGLQGLQAGAGMLGQGIGAQQQAYGQALQGAGQLGSLGNQALQNQMGILNAQQQTGALQQQQQQQIIDQAVKNYQTAQQYPYQQLGFMQNMLQGLPIGTSSTQNYQQAPSMAQNIAALGMGAYGLGQLFGGGQPAAAAKTATGTTGGGSSSPGFLTSILNSIGGGLGSLIPGLAEGGQVKGYAGGGSVESPQNVEAIVSQLSDQQLAQAMQAAQARGDFDQIQAVQREQAMRASERGGMASAFNQLPQATQQQMLAGGGIVAFSGDDDENDPQTGQLTSTDTDALPSEGDANLYQAFGRRGLTSMKRLEGMGGFTPMTAQERAALRQKTLTQMQADSGESPYTDLRSYLAQADTDRTAGLQQNKGLAALAAAQALAQPGGLVRGVAGAASAFGQAYGQALRADAAEKRSLAQMKFNLADAERKERMGMGKEADAAVDRAETARLNAHKAAVTREQALGTIATKGASAYRPIKTGAGANKLNASELAQQQTASILAGLKEQHPDWSPTKLQDEATRQFLAATKTGVSGAVGRTYKEAQDAIQNEFTLRGAATKKIIDTQYGGNRAAYERDALDRYMQGLPLPAMVGGAAPAAKPAATDAPKPMPKTEKDLVKGGVYNTSRGPATWNGKNFVLVQE